MEPGARQPILIIDDDEVILNTLAYLLRDEGYLVACASNGQEALRAVAQQPPCLILLDMKMPVMDGWAFASAYRTLPAPHAPLIVMTAAQDTTGRAFSITADGYIAKPFDIDAVLAIAAQYATCDDAATPPAL